MTYWIRQHLLCVNMSAVVAQSKRRDKHKEKDSVEAIFRRRSTACVYILDINSGCPQQQKREVRTVLIDTVTAHPATGPKGC
jgi:hypothetical protein